MNLNKKEIKLLFKFGKFYYYNNIFKLFFLRNTINKVSIIIPKKKIKKAVLRNKIKRRILHSLNINNFFIKINPTFLIIFLYINKNILNFNILNYNIKNIIYKINYGKIFNYRTR
ncbi:MAG: ribonuclease P protein component [Candidatus Shikimatogenerans bostrichidophilus]|nr:MAG: ribonuclease P protein component [Candidatus Shikimatogenerans bostrichidophilus]